MSWRTRSPPTPRPTTARRASASRQRLEPAATAIVAFLRERLGPDIITVHFAGQPEIDVDGDTATGTWCFEDTVIATEYRVVITGAAFYEDTLPARRGRPWRIAHTGYERTYEDDDVARRPAELPAHREPLGAARA